MNRLLFYAVVIFGCFVWSYLFIFMNELTDENLGFKVKSAPSWTIRGLRSQNNDPFDFEEVNPRDGEYYNEITHQEVMEAIGDKIRERIRAKRVQDEMMNDIWQEPSDNIAVRQAKIDHTEGKHRDFKHNMTIWTLGFSVAEVYDVQNVIRPFGVKIVDRSFSSLCSFTNSCAADIAPSVNRTALFYIPPKTRREFHSAFHKLAEVKHASAILCLYPVLLCDLLYRLGKPVIFLTPNRYEMGKSDVWAHWNYVINLMKVRKKSVIAARDNYDAKYLDYFTQSHPIVLERHCGYVNSKYAPIGKQILLYPGADESFLRIFYDDLQNTLKTSPAEYKIISQNVDAFKLKHYNAIIYIPYKVSSIKFIEIYRMNIPLFIPSLRLLINWEAEQRIIKDRIFPNSTEKYGVGGSLLGGKAPQPSGSSDPNTFHRDSLTYWLRYLEYYDLPGVQYFRSVEDLGAKLTGYMSLSQNSREMATHNARKLKEIGNNWLNVIKTLRSSSKDQQTEQVKHYTRSTG